MALLDSPWKNALLGLASLSNPGLLQQVAQGQQQQQEAARQQQEAELTRKIRQAQLAQMQQETDIAKQEQSARQTAAMLAGPNPPSPLLGSNLPVEDRRQQALGLLAPYDETAMGTLLNPKAGQSGVKVMSGEELGIGGEGYYEVKTKDGIPTDINSLGGRPSYNLVTDPFGRAYRIYQAAGTVDQVFGPQFDIGQPPPQQQAGQPAIAAGPSLSEAVAQGTGPAAKLKSGLSNIIGPFIEGSVSPETERSKAQVRLFNQEAKQALVNNPRFPVAEQKIVQELLPDTNKFWTDPDAEREKLSELRRFLVSKKQGNLESMQSGQITQTSLGQLADQNKSIDRILKFMEGAGSKYSQMNKEQLQSVNIDTLSGDELDQYIKALEQMR